MFVILTDFYYYNENIIRNECIIIQFNNSFDFFAKLTYIK